MCILNCDALIMYIILRLNVALESLPTRDISNSMIILDLWHYWVFWFLISLRITKKICVDLNMVLGIQMSVSTNVLYLKPYVLTILILINNKYDLSYLYTDRRHASFNYEMIYMRYEKYIFKPRLHLGISIFSN